MKGYMKEYERYQLEILLKEGCPVKKIASVLGRCRATIYNEMERGKTERMDTGLVKHTVYDAYTGQRVKEERSHNKGVPLKVGNDMGFVKKVEELILKDRYSPYASLAYIRRNCPGIRTDVCTSTLYSYIRKGLFLHVTGDCLPYRRKRRPKRVEAPRTALNNVRGKSIDERPKAVSCRGFVGDWEMDTVVSGQKKSRNCLLVLTERKSRLNLVRPMPDKSAASTARALDGIEHVIGTDMFRRIFRTITTDNGCEFLDPDGMARSVSGGVRTDIYHCHPYRSNERGSNEKQNQMLRRWFPKGCALSDYSQEYVQCAEDWLNNYPRAMFGGMTAREVFELDAGAVRFD